MNYIGIENDRLEKVGAQLNLLLASYSVYYQNLRSFHWHVNGNNFFDMHELFEDLYNDAKEKIDIVAERILTIGQKPTGSMAEYLMKSSIKEAPDQLGAEEMATTVLENHLILIFQMRTIIKIAGEIGDEGTIDIIGGFLSNLEKRSWILNSWKEKRSVELVS